MFSIIYKLSRKYNIASKILRLLFGCDIPTKALIGKNVAFYMQVWELSFINVLSLAMIAKSNTTLQLG